MELPDYHNIVMKNNAFEKHFIRDVSAILLQLILHMIAATVSTEKLKYTALSSAHSWAFSAASGVLVA